MFFLKSFFKKSFGEQIKNNIKCKICGENVCAFGHPNFYYCKACGSYSNYLPRDTYNESFWCKYVSNNIIKEDIKHWYKVDSLIKPYYEVWKEKYNINEIIDLAGGLGLLSYIIQENLKLPVINVDKCVIPKHVIQYKIEYTVLKKDVFNYLENSSILYNKFCINSHFIEHLELTELKYFFYLVKEKFKNSIFLLYCPNASATKGNEANFLHFNTNLPGEYRIVWSYSSLKNFLTQKFGFEIYFSKEIDLDMLFLIKLEG